jgi:ADP-heptose:LPS heptosyltransferase
MSSNSQKLIRLKKHLKRYKDELKVLIIRNGMIGDMVFITPVIIRLSSTFPNISIDVVTGKNSSEVLNNFQSVRNIFPYVDSKSLMRQIMFFLRLRKQHYDVILIQEVNTHYTIMSKLASGKFFIGYKNSWDFLLDIKYKRTGHVVEAELQTVTEWTEGAEKTATHLICSAEETEYVKLMLSQAGVSSSDLIIMLQIGCSETNSVRQWATSKYAQLADRLSKNFNAKIIFTGTQADQILVEQTSSEMKSTFVSFAGKTSIRQLIALTKFAKLIIGPDTGTLHIANAVGVPVIMLMGFADPADTGPYDITGISKYINVRLDCLPCKFINPKPLQWEICKITRPTLCMDLISVDTVYVTAMEILNKTGNVLTDKRNDLLLK